MRILLYLLTATFVVFAYLQLNDPDPWLWAPLYLLPAAVTLLAARGQVPAVVSWGLGLIYAALAAWWWPARYDGVTGAMNPHTTVEEARESLGLLIAATGLALSGYAARRNRIRATPAAPVA